MSSPTALFAAALALMLLPGCAAWRGHTQARREAPSADSSDRAGTVHAADDGSPVHPVALDGSATDDAVQIPNAPAIAAAAPQAAAAQAQNLAAAASKSKADKAGTAGRTNTEPEDLDQTASEGVTTASASTSSSGTQEVAAADLRTEERAPGARPNTSITDLPGSFDVVGDGVKIEQGVVAATVNGHPIFVEDVIRDLPIDWARARKEMSPEQFRAVRRQVVEQHLQRPIEEELLIQALKTKMKEDQLKHIISQIDTIYNKEYLPNVMKQQGFSTEAELDQKLRKTGSSIEILRTKNRNRELARQYIGAKVMPKSGFDRPDLLKYYNDHKEDFAIAAQAKWEQIQLKYSKNGGKEKARTRANEILKRIQAGEDFAAVARECSNGPTASRGGARGWTTRGSLKDQAVEQALFEQPLEDIGPPIEGAEAIEIVRVLDRTPAGYYSFLVKQEDIKEQLKNEAFQKASKELFEELTEKATIVKFTDKL